MCADVQGFPDPPLPRRRMARQGPRNSLVLAAIGLKPPQGGSLAWLSATFCQLHGPRLFECQSAGFVSIKTSPCAGIVSTKDPFFTACLSPAESLAAVRSFLICSFVGYRGEPMSA